MLKDKRFLITQSSLRRINGSEIVTFELAKFLRDSGAHVTVYTLYYDNPIKEYFEKENIHVIGDDSTPLNIYDYDYIWVHHQVLPSKIINALENIRTQRLPRFIFFHMSMQIGIEKPYTHDLEQDLASKILFVSKETEDALLPIYTDRSKLSYDLFPNPAPVEYSKYSRISSDTLKNILIVSNHPPEELTKLKGLLRKEGMDVASMGEIQGDVLAPLSLSLLRQYDLVITIGKTVQYCLCAGIPVFIYDHFGGPGYLNEKNFSLAAEKNFSGRGFTKYSPEELLQQIIDGYQTAQSFQMKNREIYIKAYSIDHVFKQIIANTKSKMIKKIPASYIEYLKAIKELVHLYIVITQRADTELANHRNELEAIKDDLSITLNDLDTFKNRKLIRVANKVDKILRSVLRKSAH